MAFVRHKAFISYHHDDQNEVDTFVRGFDDTHDVFIARALGIGIADDIINSSNVDYIMQRIRDLYLKDSSVTLVLIGRCTWARRFVDWEIQASLRQGATVTPNGLLGVVLPSAGRSPEAPARLDLNLKKNATGLSYAKWYWYPENVTSLKSWIEDAYSARTTRNNLIENPRERMLNNRQCI